MEVVLNVHWDAEFANRDGDVVARRDIVTSKVREEEERCTPKMGRFETSKDTQYY